MSKVCDRCETVITVEWFLTDTKETLCLDCYKDGKQDFNFLSHTARDLCVHKGCRNTSFSYRYNLHRSECCEDHQNFDQVLCTRCGNYEHGIDNICTCCHIALSVIELQIYRSLGDPEQLKRELDDYRSLGSYDRLADLSCRADILDHCDELNI